MKPGKIENLKALGKTVTQGDWWMDSHGEALVCHGEKEMTIILQPKHLREKAHRDENTGGLSYWPNDSDASWIASAQPKVVLEIIEKLEKSEADVIVAERTMDHQAAVITQVCVERDDYKNRIMQAEGAIELALSVLGGEKDKEWAVGMLKAIGTKLSTKTDSFTLLSMNSQEPIAHMKANATYQALSEDFGNGTELGNIATP